jgi:hypothetical protein
MCAFVVTMKRLSGERIPEGRVLPLRGHPSASTTITASKMFAPSSFLVEELVLSATRCEKDK